MKTAQLQGELKNHILSNSIFERYASVRQFCMIHHLHISEVGRLINLKKSPLNKRRNAYIPLCHRLAWIFNYSVQELFPLDLYQSQQLIVQELLFSQLTSKELLWCMLDVTMIEIIEQKILNEQRKKIIFELMESLTQREQSILSMRFGFEDGESCSQERVGKQVGVNKQRIQQIEARAMGILRRPYNVKKLESFL